jgi:tetratricopeptide (TPR) repeat protein
MQQRKLKSSYIQNEFNLEQQISEIDRLMTEIDISKKDTTPKSSSRKSTNNKRRELLFQPAYGAGHYNGFLIDTNKRKQPKLQRRKSLSNTERTQRKGKSSVVQLVRTLQDPDYNVDLTSEEESPLFLFLSTEEQNTLAQSELKRNSKREVYSDSSRQQFHPSQIHRADSVMTFVSHNGFNNSIYSYNTLDSYRSVNNDLLPPEDKLQIIDESCEHILATWYRSGTNGYQLQDVVDMRITALALARMIFGQKSLQFAKQVIELAATYVKMDQIEQAMPHLRKSLTVITEYLNRSKESYDTITLFSTMSTDKTKQAMREGKRLLPSLLLTLGRCYIDVKLYADANTCLQEAQRQHENYKVTAGEDPEHDNVGYEIMMSQSSLYMTLRQFDQAISCLQQAWEIKEALVQGEDHEDIAKVYREMGSVHWKKGNLEEAVESFNRAFRIYNDLPDEVNAANASIVSYLLGLVKYQMGQVDKALSDFELAKTGIEKYYGPVHEKTLKVYYKLADLAMEKAKVDVASKISTVLSKSNLNLNNSGDSDNNDDEYTTNLDKAIKLYRDVLRRQIKLYGMDSELVAQTFEVLGDAYLMREDALNSSLMYKRAIRVLEDIHGSDSQSVRLLNSKYLATLQTVKFTEKQILLSQKQNSPF